MFETFDLLVYAADATDYDNEGLCGPLTVTGDPRIEETAGGDYCLDFEHPYDAIGRWQCLRPGNKVKAWVMMRTPPDIDEDGAYATSVQTWKVSRTASRTQRDMYDRRAESNKAKRIKRLPGGLKVAVLKVYDEGRWKIRCKYGTGWIAPEGLDSSTQETVPITPDATGLDAVLGGAEYRPQMFEITQVERSMEGINVHCQHDSYGWMKNVTRVIRRGSVSLVTALNAMSANCEDPHDYNVYTDVADERTGVIWEYRNPIDCMMNPDDGALVAWNCELLRDNNDFYLLHHVGEDRGAVIEVGRNLAGMSVREDTTGLATYLMPIGVDADGKAMLLPEKWIVSSYADNYPQKYIYPFWAEDATVDDDNPVSTVRTRMRQQCYAMLAAGCAQPVLSVSIEVAQVEDPETLIEALNPVLLYDTVRVYDVDRGIEMAARLIRRVADPRTGRLLEVELGTAAASIGTGQIAVWQVPDGVDGGKITPGTLSGVAIQDGSLALDRVMASLIVGDMIQGDTIVGQHIVAGAISTDKIAAAAVTADKLDASAVATKLLVAMNAVIQNIDAGHATVTTLDAAFADLQVLEAGSAMFDRATVQHLVAQALNLTFGVGQDVFISNLRVAYAQMVSAAIGNLCIKASDGNFYLLDVNQATGAVTATQTTVTPEEEAAGETTAHKTILDTDITAASLSTATLLATYGLVNKLDAARINVDTLIARQAFIDTLATREIVGERAIRMIAGQSRQVASIASDARIFREEPTPPYDVGDLWVVGDEVYICQTAKGIGGDFDDDDWIVSNAYDAAVGTIRQEVGAIVEVDTDGLHVKGAMIEDGEQRPTGNEVHIDSSGMNVKLNGDTYSQFKSDYAQFGNYQVRRTADGGLAFKLT